MFEHFGLKDLFVGLWKYKIIILIVTVITTILLSVVYIKKNTLGITSDTDSFYTENLYYVNQLNNETNEITIDGANKKSENVGQMIATVLVSNVFKEQIFLNMFDQYTDKEIADKFSLQVNRDAFDAEQFFDNIGYKVDNNVGVIKVMYTTNNEELSNFITEESNKYVEQLNKELFDKVEVNNLGNTIVDKSNGVFSQESTISKKILLVIVMFSFVLICIVIFFIILFNPTINRRSDFAEYGVDVLGEIHVKARKEN